MVFLLKPVGSSFMFSLHRITPRTAEKDPRVVHVPLNPSGPFMAVPPLFGHETPISCLCFDAFNRAHVQLEPPVRDVPGLMVSARPAPPLRGNRSSFRRRVPAHEVCEGACFKSGDQPRVYVQALQEFGDVAGDEGVAGPDAVNGSVFRRELEG